MLLKYARLYEILGSESESAVSRASSVSVVSLMPESSTSVVAVSSTEWAVSFVNASGPEFDGGNVVCVQPNTYKRSINGPVLDSKVRIVLTELIWFTLSYHLRTD